MDRESAVCTACGFSYSPILHMHHVKPRSEGGDNATRNLIFLCPNCHALVHQLYKLANPKVDINDIDSAYQTYIALKDWIRENLGNEVLDQLSGVNLSYTLQ